MCRRWIWTLDTELGREHATRETGWRAHTRQRRRLLRQKNEEHDADRAKDGRGREDPPHARDARCSTWANEAGVEGAHGSARF